MVRLKASFLVNQIFVNRISIPYGAIKSVMKAFRVALMSTFQFLMVRLKVIEVSKDFLKVIRFQFLMVRLKAFLLLQLHLSNQDFNSLWCD